MAKPNRNVNGHQGMTHDNDMCIMTVYDVWMTNVST